MKGSILLFLIVLLSCSNHTDIEVVYPPGGYAFSKHITNENFYCHPLIDKISRRDSFWKTYYEGNLFRLFKEPNISLEPSNKPIIRFLYSDFKTHVFILTENEITIKSSSDNYSPQFDFDKLTPIERTHFIILRREYPLDEPRSANIPPDPLPPPGPEEEYKKKMDSIKKNTPALLKREYFDYLLKKAVLKDTFSFTTHKIEISEKEFIKFVTMLNQSGYWNLPYNIEYDVCSNVMDNGFLSLEINAGGKYNYVESSTSCVDTSKFYRVCHEILKIAKMSEIISLLRSDK